MDENADFSQAIEKVRQMMSDENGQNQIQNILSMFTGGSETDGEQNTAALPSASSFDPSDIEMLMKMKKVMSAMNTDGGSRQAEFLTALKPFLKKERRGKVEQAVKLMKAAKVLKAFREINEGGDRNIPPL